MVSALTASVEPFIVLQHGVRGQGRAEPRDQARLITVTQGGVLEPGKLPSGIAAIAGLDSGVAHADADGRRGRLMIDDQLGRIYAAFNVPSDQIAQNLKKREEFVARVQAETGTQLQDGEIIDRLIYLRKQGRLPRVRR